MYDYEIKIFYNSIKDPSWPDINSYVDFIKLPQHIRHECSLIHNLEERKQEICDPGYWINLTTDVWVYKNLSFVPIQKCASMHYTTIFTNLGWTQVNLIDVDLETTKFFGVMSHPIERHFKGMVQWLTQLYGTTPGDALANQETNPWIRGPSLHVTDYKKLKQDLADPHFRKLISQITVGDSHSIPYHLTFGKFLDKVNWIPLDILTDSEQVQSMINFCKINGCDVNIPLLSDRIHTSNSNKADVLQTVIEIYKENPDYVFHLYKILGTDLNLFYNLVDTFSIDWAHLN